MDAYEKAERKGRERAELMLQDCEVGPYLFYEVELMAD
jgi:hypothetical protein